MIAFLGRWKVTTTWVGIIAVGELLVHGVGW